MADSCPVLLGNPALSYVDLGASTFVPLATNTYSLAISQSQVLANFATAPISAAINFDFDEPVGGFVRPVKPVLDTAKLEFDGSALDAVGPPPAFEERDLNLDAMPTFDVQPPALDFPNAPAPLNLAAPTPPTLPTRASPVEPGYVLPDVPDLELIDLPPRPDLSLPTFDATPPSALLPELIETWSFDGPAQYVSALLDKVRGRISTMLDGGTGIPVPVQEAIWQRAASQIDVDALRVEQEIVDDFATRGFSEPNGIMLRRLDQARQKAQTLRAEQARDRAIEEARLEQANLQFAVQQAIALEGVEINLHLEIQRLLLAGAQFQLDAAVRVLEAKASVVRLAYDIFKAKAEVYESQIRAELAKVEIYRADVEAAKVRGELNEQLVRRYEAQIRAVAAMADFYNTRVQAFRSLLEADTQRIEQFKAEVQAFEAQYRAKESETNAYRASIEARLGKAQVYDTLSRVFATRVSAARDMNATKIDYERLRTTQYAATLQGWDGGLRLALGGLEAERSRVQAVAQGYDAKARIYGSEAQVETAVSAARDRSFELGLEKERARVELALKDAEIRVQESIQLKGLMLEAQKTVAAVLSQLAAALASVMNFSAGVTSGVGESKTCSVELSGELAT